MPATASRWLEIVNPSDAYTIDGTDTQAACAAILILGEGKYGLLNSDGDRVMSVFLFGGHEEFCQQMFGGTIDNYIDGHKADIAAALDTVRIGSIGDREELEEALEAMAPSKRAAFLEKRNDNRRTSMNDIGSRAAKYAKLLRELATETK